MKLEWDRAEAGRYLLWVDGEAAHYDIRKEKDGRWHLYGPGRARIASCRRLREAKEWCETRVRGERR